MMFETKLMIHVIHWIKKLTHPLFHDCLMTWTRNCHNKLNIVQWKMREPQKCWGSFMKENHYVLSWNVNVHRKGVYFCYPLNMIKIKLFILESQDPWLKNDQKHMLGLNVKCRAKCWIIIFLLSVDTVKRKNRNYMPQFINSLIYFLKFQIYFLTAFQFLDWSRNVVWGWGVHPSKFLWYSANTQKLCPCWSFHLNPYLPATCTEFRTDKRFRQINRFRQIKGCRV